MKLYKIHKWSEVFENSDSRKRVRLGYYYMPSGCDSSGYLGLMSEFEPAEAWQAYGIFVALCQHAATMDKGVRGSFLNSDGTPMSVRRLALIIRADVGILERSLKILMHQSVKWVSAEDMPATCQSPADRVPENSGFVQGQGQGQGQGQDTMSDEAPPAEDSVDDLFREVDTPPEPEPEVDPEEEFLEALWNASPGKSRNRSSKKEVKQEWRKIPKKDRPPFETVMESLLDWVRCPDWTKEGGKYATGLHRWIKACKWESSPDHTPEEAPKSFADQRKIAAEQSNACG